MVKSGCNKSIVWMKKREQFDGANETKQSN